MTFGAGLAKLDPMNTPTTQADKLAAVPAPLQAKAHEVMTDMVTRCFRALVAELDREARNLKRDSEDLRKNLK